MIEWPSPLVDDLARRKVVLYLGAGVSASSRSHDGKSSPPTWEGFLRSCLEHALNDRLYIEELIDKRDYLTACELIRDQLTESWNQLLTDTFLKPKFVPAELHKQLFKLDCRLVLTPNFDKIYDVHAQTETQGSTLVKNYYEQDTPMVLRANYRAVIKVHGTIDEPSRTVFTRSDYARVRTEYRSFQHLIDALFLTHTFLFIGCSLNDPDLGLFLEQHAYRHPSAPSHYMTSPDGEIAPQLTKSVKTNSNIRLLRYDPADLHKALLDSITALVPKVDDQRAVIASRMDW